MRTRDVEKQLTEKAAKTINFDLIVLQKIEERAKALKIKDSKLVNMLLRRVVMNDVEFFREMSKYHYLEFQKFQFLKEQVLAENTIQAVGGPMV